MIYVRLNKFSLFFLLCTISFSHAFAIELVVPDVYKLIKVNGKSASSNFFSSETVIDLKRGENILVVQFSELFDNVEDDDHITIKSDPQVVLFNFKESAIEKYFMVAPTLSDGIQAQKFAESPLIAIKYIDIKSGQIKSISVLNQSLTEFQADVAFKKMANKNLLPKNNFENAPNQSKVKLPADALNKLMSWWNKADNIQKKRFIEYIQQ
jgi:uncharacterized protein YccT (UPF0319 family)